MNKIIKSVNLVISLSVLTIGCNTISYSTLGDNVRKVIVYQTDNRLKIVSEKIEMEDPLNYGQWWEAKKVPDGTYALTVKGLASKKSYEDGQVSVGNMDGY